MLRPGQQNRAARGFGGGGGGRRGGAAPGRRLYRARRGRVAVWIATDVVGHLGQMQILPLRHSSFPMNPNNPGFADLTSQRDFSGTP